jgi:hypothetical protein
VSDEPAPDRPDRRWPLLGGVLIFQLKLAVDAVRDLVLSPLSLVAALLDLVTGTERERLYFERVLAVGRATDRWIDLFGAEAEASAKPPGFDRIVERVEALVVEQYERGGVTAQAKAAIDRSLDRLSRRGDAPSPPPDDDAP